MTEQVRTVGEADAGHPQVSAETVTQGVHRGGLDARAPTDVLQLLEDVAVALAGAVRERPLIARSIRVLLEEKLLHVGEIGITRRGSKAIDIEARDYAHVERVDAKANQITVRTDDDCTLTYDPRRLQGVTLYRETERNFAAGDRVQMTAPDRERGVPNRKLGTVERVETNGRMEVQWDSGRTSSFEPGERRHLDYGYAVTSHCSQGQTAGRVLVHIETDRASEKLVNHRLAYVAVSRGQYDARIYTDDKVELARRSTAMYRTGRRWKEQPSRCRGTARSERYLGANRPVARWPSVLHETTVLRGVKGALRRLRRP